MFGSNFLDKVATESVAKPTNLDMIYYLFWEKGIDYNAFSELPLPYIFNIMKTFSYIKEEEKKEMEKAKRK